MRVCLWILTLGLVAVSGGISTRANSAVVPVTAAANPVSQFYVLSFTEAPISEVAEAVVGGALSRELVIDPAIDGTMSFSVEGAFTSDALLQEFGTAALDQDVVLMRSRAGDLTLMPRANMAAALARGSALVALAPPRAGPLAGATAAVPSPIVYGAERWWEGPIGGLLIFLTGAVSGACAVLVGQRLLRPAGPPAPAVMRITQSVAVTDEFADRNGAEDPELTIPRFEVRARDGQGSRT